MKKTVFLFIISTLLLALFSCDHNVYIDDCEHKDTVEHVLFKAVTCLEDGNCEYFKCTKCGKLFEDENCTIETTIAKVTKKAPGSHLYGQWEIDKEATCAEEGSKHHTCTRVNDGIPCNHVSYETIPKTDEHNHTGSWITTNSDKHWKICPTCTEKIDEDDHTFTTWTYNEQDQKWYRQCSVCNRQEEDSYQSHHLKHYEAKDATCTEDGNIEYWQCTICSEYYSDNQGNTEVTNSDTLIIPKLGHIIPQNPTKTDYKYDDDNHWLECERCSEHINTATHDFQIVFNADTASRTLTINSFCTVCGKEYTNTKPSQSGAFDISVADKIEVQRTAPYANSWVISVKKDIANKYKNCTCKWYGNNNLITGLEGTDSFTVSCGVTGEDTYFIYCQITDSNENLMEVCTVQISR